MKKNSDSLIIRSTEIIRLAARLKDKILKSKMPIRCAIYEHTPLQYMPQFACNNQPLTIRNLVDLVTIAFNNDEVIAHQIRLVKKYMRDPYNHLIADNSSDLVIRRKIFEICREQQVSYLQMPSNPYSGVNGSCSQGLALNWVLDHYILPRQAEYFGFLDHDIFPIHPTKVIDLLNMQKIWGHIQKRDTKWYLWAGYCFFERAFVQGKKLNFFPGDGMDTGGMNWSILYEAMDMSQLVVPKHEYGHLREGDCAQSDWYEFIGDWVHTFNASNWMAVAPKMHLVDDLLNKY